MAREQNQVRGVSPAATAVIAALTFVIGIYAGTVVSGMRAAPVGQGGAMPLASMSGAPQAPAPQARQEAVSPQMARDIAALEVLVSSHPDDLGAWTRLGHLYFDTDQFEQAIRAYERSLALDASKADVWTDLGVMYRRVGQSQKAVQCFDKAVLADPGHQTARFNKGVVLFHDLNDQAGALAAWKDLLAVNPGAMAPNGVPVADMVREFEKANAR